MKRLWPFAVFMLLATCSVVFGTGVAQQGPQPQPFTLTAVGQFSPIIASNSNCSVVVYSVGGGATLTPQSTSDLNPSPSSPWNTASGVNSGSMTAAGTYTGSPTNQTNGGLTGFRVILTALTSGTVSGALFCNGSQPPGALASGAVTCPQNAQGSCIVAIAQPTDAAGRLVVTTPPPVVGLPLPTDAAGRVLVTTPAPCATNTGGNACNVTLVEANASPMPVDAGGMLLLNTGCSKFTSAAQNATTVVSGVGAHFCGIETTVTLTSTNASCYNNASSLSGTILSALGTASVLGQTGNVAGGKTWATLGITCGSASGAGTILVFWDT